MVEMHSRYAVMVNESLKTLVLASFGNFLVGDILLTEKTNSKFSMFR